MNQAYEYAVKVLSGSLVAPSQVRKAAENFINEFDVLQHQENYPYFWNEQTEQDVITILNALNFARGVKAGQSIGQNLALWQYFLILNIFCWQHKNFVGKRKIQEVIVTVSRKNSKSILAVLVHLIAFFLDGENATHYCASNTKNQAQIVFDEMSSIILSSPELSPLFKVQKTYIDFLPKRGKIKALSGDSRKQDGIQPWVATIDECAADNEISKMIASIETGQMGVRNPIVFKISTSYGIENAHNYFREVVEKLVKNTMTGNENPRIFGLAYNIDSPHEKIGDKERWECQEFWAESNPLVNEAEELKQFLIESYETKKHVPIDFHEFKIKQLNLWLQSEENTNDFFIDLETLQRHQNAELVDWSFFKRKLVFVGIDLSLSKDNTAVTFAVYDTKKKKTYLKNMVFYPKNEEKNKIKAEGLPYDRFRNQGYCMALGEESVDFEGIGKWIHEIVEKYQMKVATILYDTKYSQQLMTYLNKNVKMQVPSVKVKQDSKNLGPVISALQKEMFDGNVEYAFNPFFESACINGKIEFRNGKPYITKKDKHRNKIDSLFATFNAYEGIMVWIATKRFNSAPKIMIVGG